MRTEMREQITKELALKRKKRTVGVRVRTASSKDSLPQLSTEKPEKDEHKRHKVENIAKAW